MIGTVLVANRGEIARRVMRTCRDMGLGTVAVYALADAGAPHVREADAAVPLDGDGARAYLRPEALVEAAERAGADAVHPGYGFLSESAAFARAVAGAGLTWIGPPAEAIEAMGSKTAAKALAERAGVPVSAALEPERVTEADLPVLVKASAGGGGRGMRVVRALAGLEASVQAARAEAASAFGDPAVFCEPYVERGRHVEVQVLADAHGAVWAVGDRDCSVQRRHQKVIEEAPAPGIGDGLRERLHDAARRMAGAIGYTGAGTAEFLVGEDGEAAFLEMNTRLQVEHPVTECVTGLDLVEWQVRIAEGEPLPEGGPPAPRGHAVQARLYAEDPAAGWRPYSGTVARFDVPAARTRFAVPDGFGVRVDAGVEAGTRVGVEFDPMLAKVIAWGRDRGDALRRLAAALAGARLHGVGANRDLLVRVLRHPVFAAGEMHIRFLAEQGLDGPVPDGGGADGRAEGARPPGGGVPELALPLADARAVRLSALAAALAEAERNRAEAPVLGALPAGWRNLPSAPHVRRYRGPSGEEVEVAYASGRTGPVPAGDAAGVRVHGAAPDRVELLADGVLRAFAVARAEGAVYVDSALGPVALVPEDRFPEREAAVPPGTLLAPMPGTVARVAAAAGDRVEEGAPLLWLEAMKMEHEIRAPVAGTVAEVARAATRADTGTVLAVVEPDPGADGAL
ncbi:acety-l/propionyl-CoA carboxylase subunit alpha [Nocardiopsis sp. RSe5-2]|uniref:Acety-l/propionyl-CoA carboxylase subunit alpha n=1 Tax=Nocardiopsis endophytica TaxID=3018445 RepID=A0ABT4U6S1_9ACTN|nr:biotin carboxylase N-terminal domain-containing protein [Nocardiopsis endophytica]MDA2812135.1 acety-l/propionyl-CoA carboxylase subunit alpha [Nocardiopsis endophytica]